MTPVMPIVERAERWLAVQTNMIGRARALAAEILAGRSGNPELDGVRVKMLATTPAHNGVPFHLLTEHECALLYANPEVLTEFVEALERQREEGW